MADLQTLPEPLTVRAPRPGSRSHLLLRLTRKVHLYLGVFISPALLFFAFTGAMQTFSLHEQTQGSSYKPPAWLASLAQLHKKQTTEVFRRPRPGGPAPGEQNRSQSSAPPDSNGGRRNAGQTGGSQRSQQAASAAGSDSGAAAQTHRVPEVAAAPAAKPKGHLPMKIFFLIVSIGLFLSTITGIYMSYKYTRRAWLITGVLIAGAAVPLLLLPF